MDGNIKILTCNELTPGMVLAKSILKDGNVLAYRNSPIKEKDILTIKKEIPNETIFVYDSIIYSDEKVAVNGSPKVKPFIPKTLKEQVQNLEQKYNELSMALNSIFYKLKMFQNSNIKEIREFSNVLISQTKDTNTLIQDLVFFGSSDDPIYRHGINVALLSNLLGNWIGLREEQLNLLTFSALLHDIGKARINKEILTKKASLNFSEREEYKEHVKHGYNIVKEIVYLDKSVAQGVLFHHERLDGSGYPFKLTSERIPEFSKIIAIADSFDNANSSRGNCKKLNPFEAIEKIKQESFGRLDYGYSNIFINNILNFFIGKDVLLDNGDKAQIVLMNVNDLSRPIIILNNDIIDLLKSKELNIKEFAF